MAYIYKITNKINNKLYIGKTYSSLQSRWNEHKKSVGKIQYSKRPLYEAIRKYGIENFEISLIEETENPEEKETYYIQQYRTYVGFEDCNGYNATLGGDGKKYSFSEKEEVEELIKLYNEKLTTLEISKILEYSPETINSKLNELGFDTSKRRNFRKPVYQLDKKTNTIIAEFESVEAAALALGAKEYKSHIFHVCGGKRKSAYGYKWKYKE